MAQKLRPLAPKRNKKRVRRVPGGPTGGETAFDYL